jgi:hypothetical protein
VPARRTASEDYKMLAEHSSSELALLQAAFRHASRGESQRVEAGTELTSPAQLRRALKDLALELADEDCQVLFAYMDRNKSGSVDWIEFAAVMLLPLTGLTDPDLPPGGHVSEEDMLDESAKRLFKVLDADADGIVSLDEFQTVMTKVLVYQALSYWCTRP